MKKLCIGLLSVLYFFECYITGLNLPGPQVYVVTPKSIQIHEGRSAPFYYHNWMRRMDTPPNSTTTTTTPKSKTPDLIFAEFESDSMKNIRKLLERERIEKKTSTTTSNPIYVPEAEPINNYGLSAPINEGKEEKKDMTDYFALYNNMYNNANNLPAPVYLPSTLPPTTKPSTTSSITTSTTTMSPVNNVQNIWHIIDSEKHDNYPAKWDDVFVNPDDQDATETVPDHPTEEEKNKDGGDDGAMDENFALPGFATNTGNGAENESRAIRTEPNIRFPYVNLKPFQMKNLKRPLSNINSKKGNNMYTNLDNFFELKDPARGEAQDVGIPAMRQPIERYNPAQPYLPDYGTKSKQSSPISSPMKAIANLVPPPPPPPPKVSGDDFPSPISYDSFPPYAPSAPDSGPPQAPPPQPPAPRPAMIQPLMPSADSDDNSGPSMDMGYQYKPPAPTMPQFLPTLPPVKKPFEGYSYNKPAMTNYSPPESPGYSYDKPPAPDMHQKPSYGYHYNKPEAPSAPMDDQLPPPMEHPPSDHSYGHHGPPSYGHDSDHHGPPSYGHDSDYPELIYNKPHGGMKDMGDMKGGGDMKGADDSMGMSPPAADMKPDMDAGGPPMDDSGFPHDFPGDFKFHHDDDFHYHHHHPTTTTTTTTEMPRVNRYSYYYLGKKLYYLPLYFSVYFIIYVGALIIKAVLRHKIVYPNSWRPNDTTSTFFSKRSVDSWDLSNENLHELTGKVTHAIATVAEKYRKSKQKDE